MLFKKSQFHGLILKWLLILIVTFFIIILGYKSISMVQQKNCDAELTIFYTDLKESIKEYSNDKGSIDEKIYKVPCNAEKIIFASNRHVFNFSKLDNYPLIKNSLKSGAKNNLFLIKHNDIIFSKYIDELEVNKPFLLCLIRKGDEFRFFIQGQSPYSAIIYINKSDICPDIDLDYS